MDINLKQLSMFLVEAKKETYAGSGKRIRSQRPGFIEMEYKKGNWYYRDSYSGFIQHPGRSTSLSKAGLSVPK